MNAKCEMNAKIHSAIQYYEVKLLGVWVMVHVKIAIHILKLNTLFQYYFSLFM